MRDNNNITKINEIQRILNLDNKTEAITYALDHYLEKISRVQAKKMNKHREYYHGDQDCEKKKQCDRFICLQEEINETLDELEYLQREMRTTCNPPS